MKKILLKKYGYTPTSISGTFKFMINRAVRLLYKYINKEKYVNYNWFDSPLKLRDIKFITVDGYIFTGYDRDITYALRPEVSVLETVMRYVRDGITFIDVGAHIGGISIRVAKKVGKGKVIAVEPDPRNFTYLLKNIELNNIRNIIPIMTALGSENGLARFKIFEESRLSTFTNIHDRDSKLITEIYIPVMRLDELVRELEIDNVDIVKIDVEGAEVDVLKGAVETLRKHRPILIIEIHGEEQYINTRKILEDMNYRLEILEEDRKIPWHMQTIAIPK